MKRIPLVMGNWKLNGNKEMAYNLVFELKEKLANLEGVKVAVAPPSLYLAQTQNQLEESLISLGVQNIDVNLSGAFTGETSCAMVKEFGVKYVIIGHSERRQYHNESNKFIAQKFKVIKEQGLVPVLCIGESEQENEQGLTYQVCTSQIDAIINELGVEAFAGAVIAYEPIWAIGTGRSATPEQAQDTHKFIRDHIAKKSAEIAQQVILQYGGSVNAANAKELFAMPDIDGALVGGASLKAADFYAIAAAAAEMKK